MKNLIRSLQIIAIAILLWVLSVVAANAQTTNFTTRTNVPGTKMTVPLTSSRLWRGILPLETARESLEALGLAFDDFGYIYFTNRTVITNLAPPTAILDGYIMTPAIAAASTNSYWWDFGRTNLAGQRLIYASLTATNDVKMLGFTNLTFRWQMLSADIIASGGDRVLYFPTNASPFLTTNGWLLSGVYYKRWLTNNTLFRITWQTNLVMEPIWIIKP